MKQNMKAGSIRVIILVSILLALSGMAAMISAFGEAPPNMFYGYVTLNGEDVPAGVTVSAYIDGELRGSCEIVQTGIYSLGVNGEGSDEGEIITFMICGVPANENETWHEYTTPKSRRLDLSAEDYEVPAVTDPSATPESIPPNGTDMSQLNVTVTDNCAVDIVTVNLSEIGGSEAQVMECTGGDVYSTTTNASVDTPIDDYCLQVNASDIAGNYDDSVCIVLRVTNEVAGICGDTNGDGKVDMDELFAAINAYIAEPTDMDTLFCVIDAYVATA